MANHGKKYREAVKDLDLTAKYDVGEAMALTVKTPMESAVFELEEIPARYRCFNCGYRW